MIEINLTRGMKALIDDSDYDVVSRFKWSAARSTRNKNFYAMSGVPQSGKKSKRISMHALILRFPSKEIDHINGNSLDNRRSNLREATRKQNAANQGIRKNNTSGFKGVFIVPDPRRKKKFHSRIVVNGKQIFLGRFMTAVEAAIAYNSAAIKFQGQFARLNHIPS